MTAAFLVAMGVLGVGMGLIVSQLGNVVQSSVGDDDRSEAGGIQNTAQQLGSSLGTAVLGAIVITGLIAAFSSNINVRPGDLQGGRAIRSTNTSAPAGASSPPTKCGRSRPKRASTPTTVDALVEDYEDAQLAALKTAFLFAAFLVVAAFWTTRRLPTRRFDELQSGTDPPPTEPAPA